MKKIVILLLVCFYSCKVKLHNTYFIPKCNTGRVVNTYWMVENQKPIYYMVVNGIDSLYTMKINKDQYNQIEENDSVINKTEFYIK